VCVAKEAGDQQAKLLSLVCSNVFVKVVEKCSKDQLMPIIQSKVLEGSTINTDGWKAYDGLWLSMDMIIIASSIHTMNLQGVNAMAMVSNLSGASPKNAWQSLMDYPSFKF
jgi:hypothetical protein